MVETKGRIGICHFTMDMWWMILKFEGFPEEPVSDQTKMQKIIL